jgi:tetratricopeptide (TPR) repeat protein
MFKKQITLQFCAIAFLMVTTFIAQAQTEAYLAKWERQAAVYLQCMADQEPAKVVAARKRGLAIADSVSTEIAAFDRPKPDKLLADWLIKKGRAHLYLNEHALGLTALDQAYSIYYATSTKWEDQHTKGGLLQNRAYANLALGLVGISVDQNKEAILVLDTLSAQKSETALVQSYGTLLRSLAALNRNDEVAKYYEEGMRRIKEMNQNTLVQQGVMTQNLGVSKMNVGNISATRDDFQLALKFYLDSGKPLECYTEKFSVLYSLGGLYYYCGDYQKAVEKSQEAIDLLVSLGLQRNDPAFIPAYGTMAQSYIMNEEIERGKAILAIMEPIILDSTVYLEYGIRAQFWENDGNLKLAIATADGPKQARISYGKALAEVSKLTNANSNQYRVLALNDIAKTYIIEGRYPEAIAQLEDAGDYVVNNDPQFAEMFRSKAECLYKIKRYDEAELTLQRSARFLSDTSVAVNRVFESRFWSGIFASYSELYFVRYKEQHQTADLDKAVYYLDLTNLWLKRSQDNLCAYNGNSIQNIQLFGKQVQNILWAKAVSLSDPIPAYDQMFEWLDQCKAREMYDYYASLHNYTSEKAKPEAAKLRDLHYDLIYAKSGASPNADLGNKSLYAKQLEYDSLLRVVQKIDPGFSFGKRIQPISKPAQLQSILADDESLVTYTLNDSLLTIFVLDKTALHPPIVKKVGPHFYRCLDRTLRILNRYPRLDPLYDNTPQELQDTMFSFAGYAYSLDTYLLKPVENYLKKRVVIVPDGDLHQLPFQVLISTPATSVDNFGTLNYRVHSHAISYCHSGALLAQLRYRKPIVSQSVLGIMPISDGENIPGFDNIFIGEKFAKLLLTSFSKHKILANKEANVERIIQEITGKKYVFLLTHGRSDAEYKSTSPSKTFILLKTLNNEVDTVELSRLYGIRLETEFLMSTACETSKGATRRGEGIRSVSTAFITNGAQSVCSPFNELNQSFALEITKKMIGYLKAGLSRDVALQKAQIEYLNLIKYEDPFLCQPSNWGVLILSGTSQ